MEVALKTRPCSVTRTEPEPFVVEQRLSDDYNNHTSVQQQHCEESQSTAFSFSKRRRIFTLLCISSISATAALTVHIYYPALPVLQRDLNTSEIAVNASVSVYKLMQAFWPPFIASLSDTLGRRLIYLASAPISIGSCVGLALAPTISCLIGLRVCQAMGMSPLYVVGYGVIGDIADPSSRSVYISIYYTTFRVFTLIGGTIISHLSWRFNFWFLLVICIIVFPITILFLPETLPTLRADMKNKHSVRQWIAKKHTTLVLLKQQKQQPNKEKTVCAATMKSLAPSYLARIKKLSIKDFTISFQHLTKIHIVVTLVLSGLYNAAQDCYNITTAQLLKRYFGLNEQIIGLCFLAQAVGGIIGGLFSGIYLRYWFNRVTRQYTCNSSYNNNREERLKVDNESRTKYKEDSSVINNDDKTKTLPYDFPLCKARLMPIFANTLIVQIITGIYGWCYVWNAPLPIILSLQFLGLNTSIVDSAISTLAMDFRPRHGASMGASSNLFNQGFGAIASFCISPIIQAIGVGYAFSVIGLLLLVFGNAFILLLFNNGSKWREKYDKMEEMNN